MIAVVDEIIAHNDDDDYVNVADFLNEQGLSNDTIVQVVGHLVLTRFALPIEEIESGLRELGLALYQGPTFES